MLGNAAGLCCSSMAAGAACASLHAAWTLVSFCGAPGQCVHHTHPLPSPWQESFVDPDIHDTFGAHAFYPTAARRPRTPASSSSSPLAAAAALRAGASGTAAAGGGAAGSGVSANGWRQPLVAASQPATAAAAAGVEAAVPGSTDRPAEDGGATAAAARAAAASAVAGHPTVYPAHPKYSTVFSPIGQTMMLDPTNVPGQHSITVHDPQARGWDGFKPSCLPSTRLCCINYLCWLRIHMHSTHAVLNDRVPPLAASPAADCGAEPAVPQAARPDPPKAGTPGPAGKFGRALFCLCPKGVHVVVQAKANTAALQPAAYPDPPFWCQLPAGRVHQPRRVHCRSQAGAGGSGAHSERAGGGGGGVQVGIRLVV